MTTISPRTARSHLALAIAAAASLAFANAAQAGQLYQSPFEIGSACNDPNSVTAALPDPNAAFAEASRKRCLTFCKHTVADCKQYVADATSCRIAYWTDRAFFAKQSCIEFSEDAASRKSCLAYHLTGAADFKDEIRDHRAVLANDCETWGETCLATCPP